MEFLQANWLATFLVIGGLGLFFYSQRNNLGKIFPASSQNALNIYTLDLTERARRGEIDPVVGREAEIDRAIQILSRRTKNNPLLVGPAGVGKTAIVEGLALRIVTGDVPLSLADKKVFVLNLPDMIAGTKYRGELEERVKKIVDSIIAERRQVILFIDEIHSLMQSKGTEGAMNVTDIIKPALARGELQTIGATTNEEYQKYIVPDEALERRFQLVEVGEPTAEQAVEILQGVKDKYETHHHVQFSDEAIVAAVKLSEKYIKNRRLPDKAIDVIDEAGAAVNLRAYELPDNALKLMRLAAEEIHRRIKNAPQEIKALLGQLEQLKLKERKTKEEKVRKVVQKEVVELTTEIESLEIEHQAAQMKKGLPIVRTRDVERVIAQWRGK